MYKRFESVGFEFDFVLGEYWLKVDGQSFTGDSHFMTRELAGLLQGTSDEARQQVIIQSLASIVHKTAPEFCEATSSVSKGREMHLGPLTSESGLNLVECKVVGMRLLKKVVTHRTMDEKYSGQGHSFCGWYEAPCIEDTYEILLEAVELTRGWSPKRPAIFLLSLTTVHDMCGSGYTSACWSKESLKEVQEVGPLTHRPTGIFLCQVDEKGSLDETFGGSRKETSLFGWTGNGGCGYYPSGGAYINMKPWQETGRGFEKPLVHVFWGESNTGKSTLAAALRQQGQAVYETDSSAILELSAVYANVIVLGNKWGHSLDDVKGLFKEHELDVELVPVMFGHEG